jgi:hypothetical protein
MSDQRILYNEPIICSDIIVCKDGSGDHGMKTIDACYPLLLLSFYVLKKDSYIHRLAPSLSHIKHMLLGHDVLTLLESEAHRHR